MHLSDISWDQPGEEAVRNYQKGQQLEAMVLSIDPERERISLGIKQLAKDPFSAYIADNPKARLVKGVVKEVDARSAVADDLWATASMASCALPSSAANAWRRTRANARCSKVGDEVEAKFTGVDRKSRTISRSIKAKEGGGSREAEERCRATARRRRWAPPSGDLLQRSTSVPGER